MRVGRVPLRAVRDDPHVHPAARVRCLLPLPAGRLHSGTGARRDGRGPVTYLDKILVAHRDAAAADRRALHPLLDTARACAPARGFRAALEADAASGALAVIAEVKR